jgi:hypothetical protein
MHPILRAACMLLGVALVSCAPAAPAAVSRAPVAPPIEIDAPAAAAVLPFGPERTETIAPDLRTSGSWGVAVPRRSPGRRTQRPWPQVPTRGSACMTRAIGSPTALAPVWRQEKGLSF